MDQERVDAVLHSYEKGIGSLLGIVLLLATVVEGTAISQRKTLRDYTAAPAVIEAIGSKVGAKDPRKEVTYRYRDVHGSTQRRTDRIEVRIADKLLVDSPEMVLINPRDAKKVVLRKALNQAEVV